MPLDARQYMEERVAYAAGADLAEREAAIGVPQYPISSIIGAYLFGLFRQTSFVF